MLKKLLISASLAAMAVSTSVKALTVDVDALLESQDRTFVHVNRCGMDFEVPPVVVNGRTFVEVNTLFTRLDIDLQWRQSDRRVTGLLPNGSTIHMWIGSTRAEINGSTVWLDAAPFIATGYNRTMIPLSFVATATGATVHWRNSGRTADIFTSVRKDCVVNDAQDMAEHTWRGYFGFNENGPISITPARKFESSGSPTNVYIVGMSGTDLDRVKQAGDATGIYEDILIGFFGAGNPYTTAVIDRINTYIPKGSNIILTGHSLGGMVAQQVAADWQIKRDYEILNTVTFGSPLIEAGQREGNVKRLGDANDLVPYLSVEGTILAPWQIFGLNVRDGGYGLTGIIKAHTESYRRDDVWNGFDALGYLNAGNGLAFDSMATRYYSAPGVF